MSDAVLRVIEAGPLVTVQDAGRTGNLRFGIPPSGPMDRFAHACSNAALGQPITAAALEVSRGGLVLESVAGRLTISVCGGDFLVTSGGEPCAPWSCSTLTPGDRLEVRARPTAGNWSYVGFGGDLAVVPWFGSAATHSRSHVGGATLRPGDELVVGRARVDHDREGDYDTPDRDDPVDVRVVLGPQDHWFDADAIAALVSVEFTITGSFDRMGTRLDGPPIIPSRTLALASSPVVRGSLQVDGRGTVTILGADHQTTGGYPRIATIVDVDLDRMSQRRAGQPIRFRPIDPDAAIQLVRDGAPQRVAQLDSFTAQPPRRRVSTRSLLSTNLIDGVVSQTDASSVRGPEAR